MPDEARSREPHCLYCERDSQQVPLLSLAYQGAEVWICPQHLPLLIHQPHTLADRLSGAEHFGAAEGH